MNLISKSFRVTQRANEQMKSNQLCRDVMKNKIEMRINASVYIDVHLRNDQHSKRRCQQQPHSG